MSLSQSPPVGTQEERDLDSRLDVAITNSSSLIEEALKQLAKPCTVVGEDIDDEYDTLTPIDLAISRSTMLLEAANLQLASPSAAPVELTESEVAEEKAAHAWAQTYQQIERTNDVRSDSSHGLARSILDEIQEVDENNLLADRPNTMSAALAIPSEFLQSAASSREAKRAKRLSRTCCGPNVAAIVAKIEAIDDSVVPCNSQGHSRSTSAHSFGK